MTVEHDKAIVRRYLEVFEQPDPALFVDVSEEVKAYQPDWSLVFGDRDAWIASQAEMDVTDVRVTEEDLITEDGKVACRYRVTGGLGDGRSVVSTERRSIGSRAERSPRSEGHDHVVVS
jgi:hypothetical protein